MCGGSFLTSTNVLHVKKPGYFRFHMTLNLTPLPLTAPPCFDTTSSVNNRLRLNSSFVHKKHDFFPSGIHFRLIRIVDIFHNQIIVIVGSQSPYFIIVWSHKLRILWEVKICDLRKCGLRFDSQTLVLWIAKLSVTF